MVAPSPSLLHWHCTVSRYLSCTYYVPVCVQWGKRDESGIVPVFNLERETEMGCIIFIFLGHHNKRPHAGWLKQQKLFFHSSGDYKFKINVLAGLISSEAFLLGLHVAVYPLCLCTSLVSPCVCIQILPSCKDTSQIGLGP